MKRIDLFQFLKNIDKACTQFAQTKQPLPVEELELKTEQDWWEEFKLYMEEL